MTLDDYLTGRGEQAKDFAVRSGLSESLISRLRNGGSRKPSAATVYAVVAATRGKVRLADLVNGRT